MTGIKLKRKKAYFSISAVAKMFSVHQQTIRLYEKEGLINPKRSDGNTRLFSEEDVDRLEEVIYLTHQLGINLAGVDMILKLQKKITNMQKEMNQLFNNAAEELAKETATSTNAIQATRQRLIQLKQEPVALPARKIVQEQKQRPANQLDMQDWQVDYEE
jgi:MerR family transcriptional regulator, heat shock protein HspR